MRAVTGVYEVGRRCKGWKKLRDLEVAHDLKNRVIKRVELRMEINQILPRDQLGWPMQRMGAVSQLIERPARDDSWAPQQPSRELRYMGSRIIGDLTQLY